MQRKRGAIFLTVIGGDIYSLLRNLLAPVSPSTKTVKELFEILKEHLKPQPKGIKAKVNIETNSQPKCMKAKGVFFAMKKDPFVCFINSSLAFQ